MDGKMRKDEIVQAVVLADDFATNLIPVQHIFPKILMPVINVPLLDYLVEILIKYKVQELFLYCSNHIDLIKAYVKEKKWSKITISLIVSDAYTSLGDALRDIDTKRLIRGNFILIRGDAFVNADLTSLLNDHRAKLEKDKGATMTMLLRNSGSMNKFALKQETCLVVYYKSSKKILHYSKLRNHEKKVKLELNWFLDHGEIESNACFLDTHVYLCSPSVLPLFSNNFDFQTMDDFVRGVLMNEEILNSRIYWQQLSSEDYALPIVSWDAYRTLIRDILNRCKTLTPKSIPFLNSFMYLPRCTYTHRTTTLAKGYVLEKDSIVCEASALGNDTCVTSSVVGYRCSVGSNVTIMNSFILSNSKIEDACTITNSVVFPNCHIKRNVQINGCILYPDTTVDTRAKYVDSILESKERKVSVRKMSEIYNTDCEFRFFEHSDAVECDNSSTDETSSNGRSACNLPIPDDTNMFLSEVINSLLRGVQNKLSCENLIKLEINSSRYEYNVTMSEVTYNVIKAILSLPFHYLSERKEAVTYESYQRNLKVMVRYFYPIILNYVKTEDAQDDCLRAIGEVAGTTKEFLPFLFQLLHLLYMKHVLSEEKIVEWYESNYETIDELDESGVGEVVERFVNWLDEAVEDDNGCPTDVLC